MEELLDSIMCEYLKVIYFDFYSAQLVLEKNMAEIFKIGPYCTIVHYYLWGKEKKISREEEEKELKLPKVASNMLYLFRMSNN